MTTNAVNANAINEVSFPGSQDGLSLVELLGTIVVSCSVASVSLILTASAAQAPEAKCSAPAITLRSQLSATTVPEASSAVNALVKAKRGASGTVQALVAAAPGLKMPLSAPMTGVATPTAAANIRVFRTGSTNALATGAVASKKNVYLLAAAAPTASSSVNALREMLFAATTPAVASVSATMTFQRRISSNTTASGTGIASEYLARRIGAIAVSSGLATAGVKLNILSKPDPVLATAIVAVDAVNEASLSASVQAVSTFSASMIISSRLSATTVAAAVAQSGVDAIHTVTPVLQPAQAITSSPIALTAFKATATGQAQANVASTAAVRMKFGSATTALATPGVAVGQLILSPVASTTCSASGQVGIQTVCNTYPNPISAVAVTSAPAIKIKRGIIVVGAATAVTAASLRINTLAGAATAATAATAPTPVNLVYRPSATAVCSATISLLEDIKHTATPSPIAGAAIVSAPYILLRFDKSATATGSAQGSAYAAMRQQISASTVATAIAASVAADYAVAAPAPDERQMFVPASERRMEVQI